ncbi:hypothetical protein [Staphylococcus pettenkoferi]|uniref:hypothetical protein n=1 Tax=Staphylococcus pettenkoferi TaxID=170573 RepID=UPI002276B8FF|nr:hypothetical protein [Staphylococcus pettenkoferi]MCY1592663.1 hypothetical protein [Staphylococcus pettenkoferi]MCY1623893.1 hypothetical protein [Staphylococcus pettenkoferi]
MEEKEQLAQDFALIAEGDREISINNSLISKKNKEINEYILKKRKTETFIVFTFTSDNMYILS